MRVLVTTTPGLGHIHPLVPFAQALQTAGHEVAFASTATGAQVIEASGFACFQTGVDKTVFEIGAELGVDVARLTREARLRFMVRHYFAGTYTAERARDILGVGQRWSPDLVVREQSDYAGCAAAEAAGLPYATVEVLARGRSPEMVAMFAEGLDAIRAAVGLAPDPGHEMLTRHLVLSPFPPSFRSPDAAAPPTLRSVRPAPFDRSGAEALPGWVAGLPEDRAVVYATLGTTSNFRPDVFEAIITGLRDEPLSLIATVGRDRDPAAFGTQPPSVRIERYVPQSLLFPKVHLVVCHGGSGTVSLALDHALPMVIIPLGADMPRNAAGAQVAGVARVIEPQDATPAAIRLAALATLNDPGYRDAARRVQEELRALPPLEYSVELLERLARGAVFVESKPGQSL